MSRSRDYLIVFIAAMAVGIVAPPFAARYYRDRHFRTLVARLGAIGGGAQISGEFGHASLHVAGELPLEAFAPIEQCGPITRLYMFLAAPVPPEQTARLLALPDLRFIQFFSRRQLPDDVVAGMCRAGKELRQLDFDIAAISKSGLARLGELPALERLDIPVCSDDGGLVRLRGAFPRLISLHLRYQCLGLPSSHVRIAELPKLEELRIDNGTSVNQTPPDAQVVLTDLPALETATIDIPKSSANLDFRISGCPMLRRLAVQQETCDARTLKDIANSSPELRQLAIDSGSAWGPPEAAQLARLEYLESLDLRGLALQRSFLDAIARLPHLTRLRFHLCTCIEESLKEGVRIPDWSGWSVLAQCRRLASLTFANQLTSPDQIDWIEKLESLRQLDVGGVDPACFWGPGGSPPDLPSEERRRLTAQAFVEHVLQLTDRMPRLAELVLSQGQIDAISPGRDLSKMRIRKEAYSSIGWMLEFSPDFEMP